MICRDCARYPFCTKTTKASDGCNEGIKRKLEVTITHEEIDKNINDSFLDKIISLKAQIILENIVRLEKE